MAVYIFGALVALLAMTTLLPFSRSEKWWVRGWDFPRLQIVAVAVVLLAAEFLVLDFSGSASWVMIGITTACLLYQAWWIVPYTPVFPKEVKRCGNNVSIKLSILSVNVLTPNTRADELIAQVSKYQPDILLTLESNKWWEEHLDTLQDSYHYAVKCPLENLYGMHLYSKFELHDAQVQYLVEDDVPSIHTSVELPNKLRVELHCLHPAPPSPSENEESSERDAELLIVGRAVEGMKTPVIVAGDLNDVAWSVTTRLFRKISGLLDPRVGRGMFNTFHARYWFIRWPLDHLFHSTHFTVSRIMRLAEFGSDHFPMYVELAYEGNLSQELNGLEADQEDRKLAQEKIQSESVSKEDVHTPAV